ncbi:MAG TPA: hypothetical protein VLK88_00910, partial [Gemmatimonadales bacterium]|nr:hypothetical protein [Gemmatimonadales bacterium]
SERALESVRHYLRNQPEHHPSDAIPDWRGDTAAEYDAASLEAMARELRENLSVAQPRSAEPRL